MALNLDPQLNLFAVFQIVVVIFTLIYSFDVLFMHRRYRDLGQALTKNVSILTLSIFILIFSFAVEIFGSDFYGNVGETIGILLIGVYFRKCMHSFFTKPIGKQMRHKLV